MVMLSKDNQAENTKNTQTPGGPTEPATGKRKKFHPLVKLALALSVVSTVMTAGFYGVLSAHGNSHYKVVSVNSERNLTQAVRPISAQVVNIEFSGPVDLILRQGDTPSMKISANSNMIDDIETIIDGDTLRISTKNGLFVGSSHRKIEITLPHLNKLNQRGSGESLVNGFSGETVSLKLQGSGDMQFDGQYKTLSANLSGSGNLNLNSGTSEHISLELVGSGDLDAKGSTKNLLTKLKGSGNLNAQDLTSDKAEVELIGSGDASVYAKQAVKLELRGSGDISVLGQPSQRDVSIRGNGDVDFE